MNRLTASLAESRQPARFECVKESPDKIVNQLLTDMKINQCCGSVTFWYGSEVFLLITFCSYIYIKDKKLSRSHKPVGIKDFLLFLLDEIRIRIQEAQKHTDYADPDPQH